MISQMVTLFRTINKFYVTVKMPFYAVRCGKSPGIYSTWAECEAQVKGFTGARYKKFNSQSDAQAFINEGNSTKVSSPGKGGYAPSMSSYSNQTGTAPAQPHVSHPTVSGVQGRGVPASAPAPKTKTVLSSSRLLALKGTLNNVKSTMEQLRTYVLQAEDQLEALQRGKKRGHEESESGASQEGERVKHSRRTSDVNSTSQGLNNDAEISVYTDGCCHNNGRSNARAGIGIYWGPNHPLNTAERLPGRPTNNRAEIHAAVRAVEQAKEMGYSSLRIYTDSNFLINSITKWIHKWQKNGWKLASGDPVINREDFEELQAKMQGIQVSWVHVRGHQGVPGNEAADRLANEGAGMPEKS